MPYPGVFHGSIVVRNKYPFNNPIVTLNSFVLKNFSLPPLMLKSWYPSSSPYEIIDYIVEHVADFVSGSVDEVKRDVERNKLFYCYRCRTEHSIQWFILEDKRKVL
jgi:hypothetical protein